jgi:purine catabolism regulator
MSSLETATARLISEERQYLYQQEREFNHSLMELALAGGGSSAILQKLREMTGRELEFLDLNYNPLFSLDPQQAEALRKQIHQAVFKLRNGSSTVTTLVVGLSLVKKQACFLGPVRVGKEIKGYLVLLAPEESISEVDRLAVRAGMLALAVEISRRQAVAETEARFESDVIEDLLTGDPSANDLEELARRLKLSLTLAHVCVMLRTASPLSEPGNTLKSIASRLSKLNCYFRGDDIVILYPLEASKTTVELRQMGKTMFKDLALVLAGTFTMGIGRSYPGLEGIRKSFREAEQSLTMGLQLFGEGSITCFADLGIYRLLFSLKTGGELSAFYQEYLGTLADYDRKHEGELIHTLKVYLNYSAVADTARAIHVHRNTLLYRLSRIQEITGVDLEDGETRLTLHMAILAGEVLNLN